MNFSSYNFLNISPWNSNPSGYQWETNEQCKKRRQSRAVDRTKTTVTTAQAAFPRIKLSLGSAGQLRLGAGEIWVGGGWLVGIIIYPSFPFLSFLWCWRVNLQAYLYWRSILPLSYALPSLPLSYTMPSLGVVPSSLLILVMLACNPSIRRLR